MPAILELPDFRRRVSALTVEEYHRLDEFNERGRRTELIRGTEEEFFHAHPRTAELVVEVAVSSAVLDRENAALYAEAGVKEYCIILCATGEIEVYRQPENGRYQEQQVLAVDQPLECRSVPGLQLKVADLFA